MGRKLQLEGLRFGRLTVLHSEGKNKIGQYFWRCKCDCGNEKVILGHSLCRGGTRSCGCLEKESRDAHIAKIRHSPADHVGKKYGRITVEELYVADRKSRAKGRCDCGSAWEGPFGPLVNGKTLSCGCLRDETTAARRLTHGQTRNGSTGSIEYRCYRAMIRRCTDTHMRDYPRYGGRGIKVCARWLESFDNFLADMGAAPEDRQTVDRIDNDGDYSPDNCEWASRMTQSRHRSNTVYATIDGVTRPMTEWCDVLGVNEKTVRSRMAKGFDMVTALTMPRKRAEYTRKKHEVSACA